MDTVGSGESLLSSGVVRGVLARSIDDVATVSSAGTYVYVSWAVRPVLGWQPSEMLGRAVDDFIHPEDLPAVVLARTSASSVLEGSRGLYHQLPVPLQRGLRVDRERQQAGQRSPPTR